VGHDKDEAAVTIQISQIVLIAATLGFIIYAFQLRTILLDRFLYALIALAAIIFVIDPALSTRIANAIGVGRGTDLILYAFIMFSLFQVVTVSASLREIERKLTLIVRETAISRPAAGRPRRTLI
jgi:hypothetical protein